MPGKPTCISVGKFCWLSDAQTLHATSPPKTVSAAGVRRHVPSSSTCSHRRNQEAHRSIARTTKSMSAMVPRTSRTRSLAGSSTLRQLLMSCLVRVGVGVTVLSIQLKEHSSDSGRREGRCQMSLMQLWIFSLDWVAKAKAPKRVTPVLRDDFLKKLATRDLYEIIRMF
jgi:hypothetical protein